MSSFDMPDRKMIQELRERTGLGLLECRMLLLEAKEMEAAIKLARERHKPKYMLVNVRHHDETPKQPSDNSC